MESGLGMSDKNFLAMTSVALYTFFSLHTLHLQRISIPRCHLELSMEHHVESNPMRSIMSACGHSLLSGSGRIKPPRYTKINV